MTLRAAVFAVGLVVCALPGCSAQDAASTTSPTVSPAGTPAAPSEVSASPLTGQKATPTATETKTVTELTGFTSPSGNIGCYIGANGVRCDIRERDWAPPPQPADCRLDYGQGISLPRGGDADFVWAGDTTLFGGDPLAYGESISSGILQCDSAESGITCRDTETGRGFALSREGYDTF